MRYRVAGTITKESLVDYYAKLDTRYQKFGKLHLVVEVRSFRGYQNWKAWRYFLENEPQLLRKVTSYHVISDQRWFRTFIQILQFLIPQIQFKVSGGGGV